jgi:hypothetical protein
VSASARKGCSWGAATVIGLGCGQAPAGPLAGLAYLLLVFVPHFETMFADMGASLPWATVLVLDLARSLRTAWLLWLPVLALAWLGNCLVQILLARFGGWLWCLLLGLVESALLLCLPVLAFAALYLPIFAMAGAIE